MKKIVVSRLDTSKKITVRIFRKILAVVLVLAFCISLIPYSADSAYAETRERIVFPTDTDSTTAGTSFTDPNGLPMTIYNPNGNNKAVFANNGQDIILSPKGSILTNYDRAGFARSSEKYNIAQKDFEITYIFNHNDPQDNDGGMAFVFFYFPQGSQEHTLQRLSGSGALGIYGVKDSSGVEDKRYSVLENAIAVELDAASFRTYRDLSVTENIWFDDERLMDPGDFGDVWPYPPWNAHLAITRPGYANFSNINPLKIECYARDFVPTDKDSRQRIAANSTVKVTWELTKTDEYTLTAKYYHNATTATGEPTFTISHNFSYADAFGSGGLFGGTEEVYLGFSAGREFGSRSDMTVRLVDRTEYNLYHVIGNELPWPAANDPRMLASETRYALLNSKLDFTDRKKTYSDYIFDRAYMANGTLINDISSVNFTTANQKYYMTYVKKIIEDPTTPNPPEGYRRIIFDPTADCKITNSGTPGEAKVFDVHGTLTWGEAWTTIQSKVPAIYKDETKVFKEWTPSLPDNATVISDIPPDNAGGNTTTYTAVYRDKVIEKPTPAQQADQDYVIIRFDANDLNDDTADEEIRGRLDSKIDGSSETGRETITYAVLKGTKWNYFASVAATPTLELKSPYWLFDHGSNGNYLPNSWQDARDWTTGPNMIPAHDSEMAVELIFTDPSVREKTYYAQYTENTPMGVMIKTGELGFWAVSLVLLLLGIIITGGLLRKMGKPEGF